MEKKNNCILFVIINLYIFIELTAFIGFYFEVKRGFKMYYELSTTWHIILNNIIYHHFQI